MRVWNKRMMGWWMIRVVMMTRGEVKWLWRRDESGRGRPRRGWRSDWGSWFHFTDFALTANILLKTMNSHRTTFIQHCPSDIVLLNTSVAVWQSFVYNTFTDIHISELKWSWRIQWYGQFIFTISSADKRQNYRKDAMKLHTFYRPYCLMLAMATSVLFTTNQ